MRRVSRKGESRRVLRADLVRRVLAERPKCQWPGCNAPAVDVHEPHTRGRGGSELDIRNLYVCCRVHHERAHMKSLEAMAFGAMVSGGPAQRRDLTDRHHEARALVADFPRDHGRHATVDDVLSVYEEAHQLLGDLCDRGLLSVNRKGELRCEGVGTPSHFDDYRKDETT